jgi:hypothetical protein
MNADTDTHSLQDAVQEYNSEHEKYKLIEGEFKVDQDKIDEIAEQFKKDMIELLPHAKNMIEALMRGAESEAVRWNVTKWVAEFTIKGGEPQDEMLRLLSSLKKK